MDCKDTTFFATGKIFVEIILYSCANVSCSNVCKNDNLLVYQCGRCEKRCCDYWVMYFFSVMLCFFLALFQQFVVYFERGVFFLFGAVVFGGVSADAAVAFASIWVGAGAVPLELAATAQYNLDGYAGKGESQEHSGQNYYPLPRPWSGSRTPAMSC